MQRFILIVVRICSSTVKFKLCCHLANELDTRAFSSRDYLDLYLGSQAQRSFNRHTSVTLACLADFCPLIIMSRRRGLETDGDGALDPKRSRFEAGDARCVYFRGILILFLSYFMLVLLSLIFVGLWRCDVSWPSHCNRFTPVTLSRSVWGYSIY